MSAEAAGAIAGQELSQRTGIQSFAKYEARSVGYADTVQSRCQQQLHVVGEKPAGAIDHV